MITRSEILMGRDVEYPLTDQMERNLTALLMRLNLLRQLWGMPMKVTSGYRPGKYNRAAGGAPNSAHLTCEACDFADPDGKLDAWLLNSPTLLQIYDLSLEHPDDTPGWCHLDIRKRGNDGLAPVSVNLRIFRK